MSQVEHSGKYDSETCDLLQDRPTQGTLSGGNLVRQTKATMSGEAEQDGVVSGGAVKTRPASGGAVLNGSV